MSESTEHPFAIFVRTLGRGPARSRHLTFEEAQEAFGQVLDGKVDDLQLGAFLLLLRYRTENADEVAGFVQACRERLPIKTVMRPDLLDWPSYSSGRSRGLPWFLLSALLLAENGYPVFMHGSNSHMAAGTPTAEAVGLLGLPVCDDLAMAEAEIAQRNFAYIPLENYAPKVQELMDLRSLLGVRSVINTLVRLINPLNGGAIFQGIFHPPYLDLHCGASEKLGWDAIGVIKGGGGEAERNPLKKVELTVMRAGVVTKNDWPAVITRGEAGELPTAPEDFLAVWRGQLSSPVAQATIVGTAAMALYLSGKADSPEAAEELSQQYWQAHVAAQ